MGGLAAAAAGPNISLTAQGIEAAATGRGVGGGGFQLESCFEEDQTDGEGQADGRGFVCGKLCGG